MINKKIFRIVYIEDDPMMIDLVSLIIRKNGLDVIGITEGQQGLDLVIKTIPDLILLDLMIPDLDGWELYQQFKSNEKTRNIPVIIITAKAQEIDRLVGLNIAKVDDYICKPFKPQELIDSIYNIISNIDDSTHKITY